MELYNSLIRDTLAALGPPAPRAWDYRESDCRRDLGSSELVLQKDAAYELGSSGHGSLNCVLFTSSPEFCDRDRVEPGAPTWARSVPTPTSPASPSCAWACSTTTANGSIAS